MERVDKLLSISHDELRDGIERVRDRIAAAASRIGRGPGEITLLAAANQIDPDMIRLGTQYGLRDIGENRVQEAVSKQGAAPPGCRWHLLGTLQENKINKVLPWVHMIQSVDTLELGRALSRRAERHRRRLPVLLEVKTSAEPTKHGFVPEAVPEAYAALASLPE